MNTRYKQIECEVIKYSRNMEALVSVVQKLSLSRDLETVMSLVRRAARNLTDADGATFVMREGDFCYYADEDAISPLWKGKRFPMKICISGWVMQNREPVVIEDIYQDVRIPAGAYRSTFVKSMAMVPIRSLDPIGAIGVYWANRYLPAREEVKLLHALADTTAVAMENVRIYSELEQRVRERTAALEDINKQMDDEVRGRKQMEEHIRLLSITDELTGINNRRGFLVLAEQTLKVAHRENTPLTLFFIDIDGLKRVNDSLGHDVGDAMIVDVSRLLRSTFRESDVVARLGGDEFVALTRGYSVRTDDSVNRLQAMCNDLNQRPDRRYTISFSIGVANWLPETNLTLEYLMNQADKAMYLDKQARRKKKIT